MDIPHSQNPPKQRKRSYLDILDKLLNIEELRATDVTARLRNTTNTSTSNIVEIKDEIKTEEIEIKAEYPPDVIVVDSDSDDETSETFSNKRVKTEDSGIHSSSTSVSSFLFDWILVSDESDESDDDVIYAQPENPPIRMRISNYGCQLDFEYQEQFWEPPEIEVGEIYLVPSLMKSGAPDCTKWAKAQMIEVISKSYYKLFYLRKKKIGIVHRNYLAQAEPANDYLRVGSRVIAGCLTMRETGEVRKGKGRFQLGVVGEIPCGYNDFRYLIIFDNGYWLYVQPQNVRPIFRRRKRIWKKQASKCQKKEVKYFLKGRYWPIRDFKRNQLLIVRDVNYVSNNGNEHYCNVIAIDSSLVLIRYQSVLKAEWIHRGSPRLHIIDN